MGSMCMGGVCHKCWACKMIIIGLVLILNQWYFNWDIWVVIGVLFVVKGLLMLVKPSCGHCEEKPAAKKK